MVELLLVSRILMLTGVPGGMVHSPYVRAVSGCTRGRRPETPVVTRRPSEITAVRYGSDSSVCQGVEAVGSGIAASSSASRRMRMGGFERMWYVVVPSVCAVVRVPAATRVRASPRRRGMVFSEGGRLGSSRRVWKIVEWRFESEVSERTA